MRTRNAKHCKAKACAARAGSGESTCAKADSKLKRNSDIERKMQARSSVKRPPSGRNKAPQARQSAACKRRPSRLPDMKSQAASVLLIGLCHLAGLACSQQLQPPAPGKWPLLEVRESHCEVTMATGCRLLASPPPGRAHLAPRSPWRLTQLRQRYFLRRPAAGRASGSRPCPSRRNHYLEQAA